MERSHDGGQEQEYGDTVGLPRRKGEGWGKAERKEKKKQRVVLKRALMTGLGNRPRPTCSLDLSVTT